MENIPEAFSSKNTLIRWQPKIFKTDGSVMFIYNIPPEDQSSAFLTIADINFALSKKITNIGRNYNNNFCIRGDMYISNFHAKIICRDNHYYILDEASTNGTYLNRNPVFKGRVKEIQNGDIIQFGVNTVAVFTLFSI